MRIFSDLGLCEQLGSGMKKILKVYPKEIFTISEHFITARLEYDKEAMQIMRNHSADGNGGVNGGNLSVTAQKVLTYIEKNNYVATSKMVEDLGISKRSIERAIKELRDKNLIRRVGSDKTGYYELNK